MSDNPVGDNAVGGARTRSWTVLEVLRWTHAHFAKRGIESARLDAELLLAHVRGVARLRLYLDFEEPVTPDERARFRTLLRRRAEERVPVALLTGEKEFWSLPLEVTPAVLTARPDTETLVEALLTRVRAANADEVAGEAPVTLPQHVAPLPQQAAHRGLGHEDGRRTGAACQTPPGIFGDATAAKNR